ncbi:beta-lactamase [Oesophagostomum dentatum]|uniref:Beta-lactamase n=1 Tax=Oesophagostomum dentatum TaxID=61180 RepID=A0A0B1T5H5_OESDE|nr:beta-lactamase [Oesophagostomum dentatum]
MLPLLNIFVCEIKLLYVVLRQNFINGWETEGAALAVFVNDKKVVDIWGGYADRQAARTWKKDTITVVFSTTKAVAALCIALLADRGRLKYDDPVAKYWPGFAKHGKENITIEWVMSHMAGLHYFDTPITEEMALNHDLMRKVIENETPKTPPGIRSGYHAYTYGWLVDQIVRHTDEKKRGIGQFLREEITQPNGNSKRAKCVVKIKIC